MGEKKNGKKVKASDVEPGSKLEAMLLSLGEMVKESTARSAEAMARSARAEELATEALQALLKFVQRTESRLEAVEKKL
ncbi:MAG: hypothetical protein U0359_19170 [Byssovorax sp.]